VLKDQCKNLIHHLIPPVKGKTNISTLTLFSSGPQGSPGLCVARGVDLGFEGTGVAGSTNVPWEVTGAVIQGVGYDFSSTAFPARQGIQTGLVTFGVLGVRTATFDQQHIIVCPNTVYTLGVVSLVSLCFYWKRGLMLFTVDKIGFRPYQCQGCDYGLHYHVLDGYLPRCSRSRSHNNAGEWFRNSLSANYWDFQFGISH
jgi:hypothetical protein